MDEGWPIAHTLRARQDKLAVAALAGRQWGVIARAQLERTGVGRMTISRWLQDGHLHRLYPGVYAVGHRALSIEGRLAAALLYAGPGAMLSHATAAWWWGLWEAAPSRIHVSAPGRRRSVPGLAVHGRRRLERVWHRRLSVTTVAQTLLDLAIDAAPMALRRALAEAEYRRLVKLDAVAAVARRGVAGSAALNTAVTSHRPELALTRSRLEERFLALCEAEAIPIPQVNATVCGLEVDALWEEQRVVVELDGGAAHGTPAAVERDRRRELRLRVAGYLVLRYSRGQVSTQPRTVAADLRRTLAARAVGAPH